MLSVFAIALASTHSKSNWHSFWHCLHLTVNIYKHFTQSSTGQNHTDWKVCHDLQCCVENNTWPNGLYKKWREFSLQACFNQSPQKYTLYTSYVWSWLFSFFVLNNWLNAHQVTLHLTFFVCLKNEFASTTFISHIAHGFFVH